MINLVRSLKLDRKKILYSPLPRLSNILLSFFVKNINHISIEDKWKNRNSIFFWFSKSSISIAFIALVYSKLKSTKSVNILIPDYFCSESLNFSKFLGFEIIFYNINNDLTVNINSIEKILSIKKIDIIVIVNYFNNLALTDDLTSIIKTNNIWTIEDSTHLLLPKYEAPFGDFILYSPHKHLPIPCGALLIFNGKGINKLFNNLVYSEVFNSEYSKFINKFKSLSSKTNSLKWTINKLLQLIGFSFNNKVSFNGVNNIPKSLRISIFSKYCRKLLFLELNNIEKQINRRARISRLWAKMIKFSTLNQHIKIIYSGKLFLYLTRIECLTTQDAVLLYEKLGICGCPVSSWPDIDPIVERKSCEYKVAILLRNINVFISNQQTTTRKQLLHFWRNSLKNIASNCSVKEISIFEWNNLLLSVDKSSIVQGWKYGDSLESATKWSPKRFKILDSNGESISIVQTMERAYPLIGKVIRVNRGPMLINEKSLELNSKMILSITSLYSHLKNNNYKLLFLSPLVLYSNFNILWLKVFGLKRRPINGWSSGLIDLSKTENEILLSLDGKWRNMLRKGLSFDIHYSVCSPLEYGISKIINSYNTFKNIKKFKGINSTLLLNILSSKNDENWEVNLFIPSNIFKSNEKFSDYLITVKSGDTATYLISVPSLSGRKYQVNTVLLWNSIIYAKKSGAKWFDLGGIIEDRSDTIAKFKYGVNPIRYKLVGEWIGWL